MKYFVVALCFAVICGVFVSWIVTSDAIIISHWHFYFGCGLFVNNLIEFLQAVTEQQKQNAENLAKECAGETGLTGEEVQKIRTDPKSSVKDPKAQVRPCFFYCDTLYLEKSRSWN